MKSSGNKKPQQKHYYVKPRNQKQNEKPKESVEENIQKGAEERIPQRPTREGSYNKQHAVSNQERKQFNILQNFIKSLLNVHESTTNRQQAIAAIKDYIVHPENEVILEKSYEKLLPTLEQLFRDR
jgi:hypothetical protein